MVGHLGELSPIHFGDGRIIHIILTKYVFISELAPKLMIFEAHGPKYWAQARAQGQNARGPPDPLPHAGSHAPMRAFWPWVRAWVQYLGPWASNIINFGASSEIITYFVKKYV